MLVAHMCGEICLWDDIDDACGKALTLQHAVGWQDEQRWLLNLLSVPNTLRTPAAALSFLGPSLSTHAAWTAGIALLELSDSQTN